MLPRTGGGATSPATGPSTTAIPSSGADINDRYDVGGYQLNITCSGTGTPTVVYLHGSGGQGSDVNEAIASRLAGRVVPVKSSHNVDLDQPELVIAEVNRILTG